MDYGLYYCIFVHTTVLKQSAKSAKKLSTFGREEFRQSPSFF